MAADARLVALTYGCGSTIYFTASSDGGATFSPALKVADPGILPLGRHRGPHIAIAGHSIVITAVIGKTAAGGDAHHPGAHGDLVAWRSADGGKTWSAPVTINDVTDAAREGLHGLAGDRRGNLFAAWLDLRVKGTRLYGARSSDGGASWSKNVLLYESPEGTICQCCHPTVAIDAAGRTWIMWRNSLNGDRDMYLASSGDGVTFTRAEKLGKGSWTLNACPMDGGGLAFDGSRVTTAWRREKEIYLASPGAAEEPVGEGTDVAIAAGGAGVYTAWSSNGAIQFRTPGGERKSMGQGAFPTLVGLPGGKVLAAWEDAGKILVQAP